MLLGPSGTSMLGNMLSGKDVVRLGTEYDNIDHMDKSFKQY